jgi:hypothetical protein
MGLGIGVAQGVGVYGKVSIGRRHTGQGTQLWVSRQVGAAQHQLAASFYIARQGGCHVIGQRVLLRYHDKAVLVQPLQQALLVLNVHMEAGVKQCMHCPLYRVTRLGV